VTSMTNLAIRVARSPLGRRKAVHARRRPVTWLAVLAVLLGTTGTAAVVGSAPASADVQPGAGQYMPLTPARIVGAAPVAASGTYTFSPLGKGGVPTSGVSAVAFELSTHSTGTGWLEVFPTGVTRPTASQIDYTPNVWTTNSVVTGLGTSSQVSIYNGGANQAAPLYVDVLGYYRTAGAVTAGSTYVALNPARIVSAVPVTAGGSIAVAPLGLGGIPTSNVSAVLAHVSITASAGGHVVVYPDGVTMPGTSDINFGSDGPYTNQVPAALGADGKFRVYSTQAGTVTVDIVGYYQTPAGTAAGSSFVGLTPARILSAEIIPANTTKAYPLAGLGGVPTTGVAAVAFNLTANDQGAAGALSVFAADAPVPAARQLSYRVGGHWSTLQVSKLSADGQVAIHNTSTGAVRLYLDVSGYFRAAAIPAAPTAVTAVPDNAGATVSWTAPADGGASITKYTVTASPGGASVVVTAGTSGRVPGLTNGVPYTFTVTATNAAGTSAASAASPTVTPTPPAPPGQPFVTDVTPRDGAVSVTWSPPPAGADTVTGYLIKAQPGTASLQVAGAQTQAILTGLTNGTAYRLTVSAINGNGTGAASELSVPVVPVVAQVPLKPAVTAVIALSQRVDVQWVAPPDGGADITGYTVTVNPGARVISIPAGTTVASITGLANGTASTFAVAAINKAGAGPVATVTATPVATRVPAAPGDVHVSVPANGQLTATWSAPTDAGTSTVTGYTVTATPGGATVSVTATATSGTLTGLTQTTAYSLVVRAVSAAGTGLASTASTAALPKVTVKLAPVVLSAASVSSLRAVHDDGTLDFEQPPAQVSGLTVGSLIVMTSNALAPGGFFGRVTQIGTHSGVLVLDTVPAAISEALTDGALSADGQITNADVASFTALAPGVRLAQPTIGGRTAGQGAPAVAPGTTSAKASGVSPNEVEPPSVGLRDGALVVELETEIGPETSGPGDILEAQTEIKPTYTNAMKITSSGVSGGFTVKADTETEVQGKGGYVAKYDHEWELGKVKAKCFAIPVGELPVVLCPEFIVTAKLDLEAAAGIAVSVEYSRSFTAGITITNGAVTASGSSTREGDGDFASATPFANTELELDLPVALSMFIYGAAGPAVVFKPYLKLSADTTEDPWWELRAGVKVDVALKSQKFFGKKINFESDDLIDVFDTLAQAPGAFTGLTITPDDPRIDAGVPLVLDVTVFGYPADLPIQWSVVNGPGTIDTGGVYTSPSAGTAVIQATSPAVAGRPLLQATTVVEVGPGAPGAPTSVTAVPGAFSATVSWLPPAATNGSVVTSYIVTTVPATATVRVPATATTATVTGLLRGTDYLIQVYAYNAIGASPPGSPDDLVRPTDDSFLPVSDTSTNLTAADPNIGGDDATPPQLSGNGRYVIFTLPSNSPLAPRALIGARPANNYLVRKDLVTGEIVLASRAADGATPVPVADHEVSIDGSGNIVSYSIDGAPPTILVSNLAAHTVVNVTNGQVPETTLGGKLSADGSTLAVQTLSDSPVESFVYRIKIGTGVVTKVSRCWVAYPCGNGSEGSPVDISHDGRYILFNEEVPGENSLHGQANFLYDAMTGGLTELHPNQQDTANDHVEVTALSADATTIGGLYIRYGQCPCVEGPFVKQSLTAPINVIDLVEPDDGLGLARGTKQLSDDGKVALLFHQTLTAGSDLLQIWTKGVLVDLPGPAQSGDLSGDGRVVAYLREDVPGIWVQRLN
jgi:Fibronectin type III domain